MKHQCFCIRLILMSITSFFCSLLFVAHNAQAQYRISTLVGVNPEGGLAKRVKLNYPQAIALDSAGNIYVADTGNHIIRKIDAITGRIKTIAGTGKAGYSGDFGPALHAKFNNITDLELDKAGNIYVVDRYNHRIRKIDAQTNIVSTIVGTGEGGFSGDNGPAVSALLSYPWGIALDAQENVYIADRDNHRIRKVSKNTGVITTVAGGGAGNDGDLAVLASVERPMDVDFDTQGNLFISSSYWGHKIRKVDNNTKVISTIVGINGSGFFGDGGLAKDAKIDHPVGIALDKNDHLYIADQDNHRIRKVNAMSSIITTYAGSGPTYGDYSGEGILASNAKLNHPSGIATDKQGNLYIADTYNHRIRKVDVNTQVITTIAGTGEAGYTSEGFGGEQQTYLNALLNAPQDITFDRNGNMYIGDDGNGRIRKVLADSGIILSLIRRTFAFSLTVDSIGGIYYIHYDSIGKLTDGEITRIAGKSWTGYQGDGELAHKASFNRPSQVALDHRHNFLYIADRNNHCIRQINLTTNIINTVAGTGKAGFSGDGDSATKAQMNQPVGIAVDKNGNLYIAEKEGHRVRKVNFATRVITTVAGTGIAGFSGDGKLASQAQLNEPRRTTVDLDGNIYISDYGNHRIRKIHHATGVITTIAGTGKSGSSGDNGEASEAQLRNPVGIALDSVGNIYVADYGNHRIAKLTPNIDIHLVHNHLSLLTSDTLNWEKVAYKENSKKSVQMLNLGATFPLNIQQLYVTGDFVLETNPTKKLMPGHSTNFSVRMKTNTLGKKTGTLTIVSNDDDEATYRVNLQGEVVKASQTIEFTLGEGASQSTNTSKFTLQGTASSGLFVSYTSSDPNVATILGNQITIVGAGTTEVTATQVGNEFYNPAPLVTHPLTVTQAPHIALFGAKNLPLFSAAPNSFSASQPIIAEGNNLVGVINIQTSGKFEVSVVPDAGFQSALVLNPVNGSINTTIYVRYRPNGASQDEGIIKVSSNGAIEKAFVVHGSSLPTINVSTNFLDAFNIREGQASFIRNFQVNGFNLNGDIILTAPANFFISTDGSQFFSTLRLPVSNQLIASTVIYVRYIRVLVGVDRNQMLTLQSEGADSKTVQLNGETFPHTSPFIQLSRSAMTDFSSIERTVSEPDSLYLKTYNIEAEVRMNAPPQFELSLNKQNYMQTLPVDGSKGDIDNQKIYVRFRPDNIGVFKGNLTFSSSGAPIQLVSLQGEAKPVNGPLIRSLAPLQVRRGTKITIVGENFSNIPEFNKITIGEQTILSSQIVEASQNLLVVEIPTLPSGKKAVHIMVGGKSNTSLDLLNVLSEGNSIPPVRNLNAFIRGRRTIQLSWNVERDAGIEKIVIERKLPNTIEYSSIAEITDLTNITYEDRDSLFLKLGKTYFYRAIAKGINAEAEPSNEVGVVIPKEEFVTGNLQRLPSDFLTIYPTPNLQGIFYCKLKADSAPKGSLVVFDQTNNIVQEHSQIPRQIDLSQCPSGIYYLLLVTEQGKTIKRVIKL